MGDDSKVTESASAARSAGRRRWSGGQAKPPIDPEEARRLYVEEGLTIREIARRMGYAYNTAHKAIRDQGLAPRRSQRNAAKWGRELHRRWIGMRSKCRRPSDRGFQDHGGRGIGICPEWERFESFYAWALASGFRPHLDLALIDRSSDFGPKNCRWQPRAETVRRSSVEGRRAVRLLAFGEEKSLVEWSRDPRCKVSYRVLRERLLAGHALEAALHLSEVELRGTPKLERALLQAKPRQRRKIDWASVERRLLARRTSFAALARSLEVPVSTVRAKLGHLAGMLGGRSTLLPPEHERRLEGVWRHMLRRCHDPREPLHRYIGARGMGICPKWRTREGFTAWAAKAGYRPGLWLARLDHRKGYFPANCRWLEPNEAMRQPRYNVKPPPARNPVAAFGESKSLASWARDPRCAPSIGTLRRRLLAGWNPEAALTTPPEERGPSSRLRVRAFGEVKGISAWVRDPRCKVGVHGLRTRLARGTPPEEAIATPGHQLPFRPEASPRRGRKLR